MHVHDPGIGTAQPGVQRRIVEIAAVLLVEADGHVHRRRLGRSVLRLELREQRAGAHGQIADTAFEQVTGQGGFGEQQQVGRVLPARQPREQAADPPDILGVIPLTGAELDEGKPHS